MSAFVVVDTNVVSYRFKGDTRGDLYTKHLVGRTPDVSFMTAAELYGWAVHRNWGQSWINKLQADVA